MQALMTAINVPVDQIKLISTEAVDWPNGCLGVIRMGVMCTQNVVPGFRIVLEANGTSYEYHTNQDGSIVADASQPVPNVHIAVRALDNSIQVIDTKIPIDPPNPPTADGVLPAGGANGSTRFDANATRAAFALARREPDNEQGWVAVSDSLNGTSKLIATSQPGEFYTVVGWLNATTLLIQSNAIACNPTYTNALWTLSIDGHNLIKVADGSFVTIVNCKHASSVFPNDG